MGHKKAHFTVILAYSLIVAKLSYMIIIQSMRKTKHTFPPNVIVKYNAKLMYGCIEDSNYKE